jgi:hypothetical protein
MKNLLRRTAVLPLLAALMAASAPAHAADPATGQVIAFTNELQPVTVTVNPVGCTKLPVLAHVLINQTDRTVQLYADPNCLFPSVPFVTVRPGHGSHVSAVGSFNV